jgi:hypothetical protein
VVEVVPNLSSGSFANHILFVGDSRLCGAEDEYVSLNEELALG